MRGALVWLVMMGGGLVLAQGPEGLTLPVAVEIALRSNPLTRVAAAGREYAVAQVEEARGGRWPAIELREAVTNGNNPVFVFGSLLEQARFREGNLVLSRLNNPAPLTAFRFGVTVRAPLFDQRRTATRVMQAGLRQRQAEARGGGVEQQVRFEVVRAFYGLMMAQSRQQLARESVELARAGMKLSRDRVEAGTTVVSDLLAAEVQLAEMEQQQIEADGDLQIAQASLNTALGVGIDTPQRVDGELKERVFTIGEADELMRQALAQRPDAMQAGLVMEEAEAGVRGARGEYLPRVDLLAGAGVSRSGWINGSGDYTVGASVTFNLFDAGRGARIAQARAAVGAATAETESLRNRIRLEVVRSRRQCLMARERIVVAERSIGQAAEALRIVRDRYREGLTTITEVLRAETALTRARLQSLVARHDLYVGYASLLLTTGSLTDVMPFVL